MEDRLIREALTQYGLENASWELIRHNENLTVNVEHRYLLRVHSHVSGFSTDVYFSGLDREALRRRELAFLSHLAGHGMAVQRPVPNKAGELISILPGNIRATLLTWLPGRTPNEEDVPKGIYFRAGAMTARMHRAALGFPTDGLLRYDASMCLRLEAWLADAYRAHWLPSEQAEMMQASCRAIADRLSDEDFIVVHADLSSSNILVTEAGLVPIDFSLMGVGHPMMDISCLYGSVNGVEARRQIAEGYRSEGGVISFPELDACFALNILLYIALHLNAERDMAANLDRWCRQTFRPLAEGKRLIGNDYRMLNVPD